MRDFASPRIAAATVEGARIVVRGDRREKLTVEAVATDVLRVRFAPDGQPRQERTWSVVGDAGDAPREGRLTMTSASVPGAAPTADTPSGPRENDEGLETPTPRAPTRDATRSREGTATDSVDTEAPASAAPTHLEAADVAPAPGAPPAGHPGTPTVPDAPKPFYHHFFVNRMVLFEMNYIHPHTRKIIQISAADFRCHRCLETNTEWVHSTYFFHKIGLIGRVLASADGNYAIPTYTIHSICVYYLVEVFLFLVPINRMIFGFGGYARTANTRFVKM